MAQRSLDTLRPLTPCPLAAGFQDRVSHCEVCGREVLDLSAYTREEAAQLLSVAEPPCVRLALRNGKPVFGEVLRTALVAVTLAGASESALRAIVEKPAVVCHLKAGARLLERPADLEVTGGGTVALATLATVERP